MRRPSGRIAEVGEQAGAGERDLHDAVGSTSGVRELLRGEEPLASERVDRGDRRTLDLHVTELVAPPSTPQERVDVPSRETVDGFGELALERETAHLAVGEDGEAGSFLQTDGLVDRRVLDALERRLRELVPCEPLARVDEVGWTEKAPDDIGPRDHATTLWPRRRRLGYRRLGWCARRRELPCDPPR